HILEFKQPSGTSRGIMTSKETWFLILNHRGKSGIGECGLLKGLSIDNHEDYEAKLKWVCDNIDLGAEYLYHELDEFPSIQFGLEMAMRSLKCQDPFVLFPSEFTQGHDSILINGLVWMGSKSFMKSQIREKLASGFNCIKMKIGAIDFDTEIELLKFIRNEYTAADIKIRVDANGAFNPKEALDKLNRLNELELHSIEQPIQPQQYDDMARLCSQSPLPIALDEELIGIIPISEKIKLLETVRPHYIILKPSLIGGYRKSQEWIDLAKNNSICWWITSALESNIGLNAIAQWTYTLKNELHQGLGTGSLFTNNIMSPLIVKNGTLHYQTNLNWNFNLS
ncbi:MAG: o-succinylbenzoate synthase, partial [Bacteroidia bacterium]|nr:o-succinylbenzoate synthase [Bacteroidia bacterium]